MKCRRKFFRLPLIIVTVCVCGGLWWVWSSERGRHDFTRLLAGDEGVAITRLEIKRYGYGHIDIRDAAALGYLSRMMRSANPREGELGTEYQMNVRLSTGRNANCVVFFPRNRVREITLFFPLDTLGDPVRYSVMLCEPVPEQLRNVLDRLREED